MAARLPIRGLAVQGQTIVIVEQNVRAAVYERKSPFACDRLLPMEPLAKLSRWAKVICATAPPRETQLAICARPTAR
jgi:hypothetical protein